MCFAIPDKCSDTICSILIEEMFPTFGSMVSLLTDNGKEFVSGKMADTLAALKIKHITTSIYLPMSNWACERSHRTLPDVLSKNFRVIQSPGTCICHKPAQLLTFRSMNPVNCLHFY